MITSVAGGLIAGLIYGLIACAVVFVYKASRTVNLAQGDIGMVSAFVYLSLSVSGSTPAIVGLALSLATGCLLGWLMNRLVIGPLGQRNPGTGLVATLAVAAVLQLAALEIWGGSAHFFPPWIESWQGVEVGGLALRATQLLAVAVSVALAAFGSILFRKTRFGLQLRATSESHTAAGVLGTDTERISSYAWLIGGGLSAIAALLIAPMIRFDPYFMFVLMTRSLVAALLASFNSFGIALGAALIIGALEGVIGFSSSAPGVTDALLLAFALAVLIVKPPSALRVGT